MLQPMQVFFWWRLFDLANGKLESILIPFLDSSYCSAHHTDTDTDSRSILDEFTTCSPTARVVFKYYYLIAFVLSYNIRVKLLLSLCWQTVTWFLRLIRLFTLHTETVVGHFSVLVHVLYHHYTSISGWERGRHVIAPNCVVLRSI